jgi:hypothetical protein
VLSPDIRSEIHKKIYNSLTTEEEHRAITSPVKILSCLVKRTN